MVVETGSTSAIPAGWRKIESPPWCRRSIAEVLVVAATVKVFGATLLPSWQSRAHDRRPRPWWRVATTPAMAEGATGTGKPIERDVARKYCWTVFSEDNGRCPEMLATSHRGGELRERRPEPGDRAEPVPAGL